MRGSRLFIAFSLLSGLVVGRAPWVMAQVVQPPQQASDDSRYAICEMIESAAQESALPLDFFVRLIWQESRFRPDEIGPLTRSGQRALGIAQFMPGTAMERQLFEPFNPAAALPKSGEFLAELRNEFGNLGLAAAAYNAGPQRVRDYLAGLHDLPLETRNYVRAITGRPVEEWANAAKDADTVKTVDSEVNHTAVNCRELLVHLEQTPNSVMAQWQQQLSAQWQGRNFPIWCRALQHPDPSMCGPVHARPTAITALSQFKSRSHLHLIKASLH
jgi:Transglycosylase SLT domain